MTIQEIEKKIEKEGFVNVNELRPDVIKELVRKGYKHFHCRNVKLKIDENPVKIEVIGKSNYDFDDCYEWYRRKYYKEK